MTNREAVAFTLQRLQIVRKRMRYKIAIALFNGLNYVWNQVDNFFFWLTEKIWDHSKTFAEADHLKQARLAEKERAEKKKIVV